MKVLFICEGFNSSSVVAQPWKHVGELAQRMSKHGVDIKIASDSASSVPKDDEVLGIPIRRVRKKGIFFDTKELSEAIGEEDADVVNWQCSDVWSSIHFWRLRKRIDANVVWTLHSGVFSFSDLANLSLTDYFQLHKFWNNIFNATLPRFLVRRWIDVPFLRHVIALSRRTAERLESYGLKAGNITAIPSGVDTDVFQPFGNKTEDKNILYFGPASSFRGVDVLLSVFKLVRQSLPSARLVLLARGSDRKGFWLKKAEKLADAEIVTGILNQNELIWHLNRASVVVLPFKFWPQVDCPLTILEAMALGKAVVTTPVGGIPEMIRNWVNGVLVSPRNSKETAEVVVRLLSHPLQCRSIGRNARTYVECFHDWKNIVKDTLDVLTLSL